MKISLLISNPNLNTTTLDAAAINENLNYISKSELFLSVASYINSHLIFNDIYIDDPTIALNIKLNS